MTPDAQLQLLGRLVGTWGTEATHPAMPGVVVHGTATIEWLEGERFLIVRARTDHPQFPDAISILGAVDQDRAAAGGSAAPRSAPEALRMHYYDSRGVFRDLEASIDETTWRLSYFTPGFSQRFTGTFADGGATISGLWEMCEDGRTWRDDLRITYRRRG